MHMSRQEADVRAFMEDESFLLDPRLDYSSVPGLSSEVIEKLNVVRPTTIVSCFYIQSNFCICILLIYDDGIGCCKEDGGHDTYFCDLIAQSRETNLGTGCTKPCVGKKKVDKMYLIIAFIAIT